MSAEGFIYALCITFHDHLHFHYNQSFNLIKTNATVFLHILFSSSQKSSLEVLLSFCLIFCQFQPHVAYESVAYQGSMHLLKSSFSK